MSGAPPPVTRFVTVTDLRQALQKLDVKVAHSIQHPESGKWKSLDLQHLTRYYSDRRQHMIGEQETVAWARQQAQPVGGASAGTAIAFWHNLDKKKSLPWFAHEGSGWKGGGGRLRFMS